MGRDSAAQRDTHNLFIDSKQLYTYKVNSKVIISLHLGLAMAEYFGHDPPAPEAEAVANVRHVANILSRRPLRDAVERLVAKTQPKQVACLGAGSLYDIPYRALVRGGASVHLVDPVLGNVERGIALSMITTGEDGRPECVYCTLGESDARIYCRRFRVTAPYPSAICDRFEQSANEPLRCEAFERGGWPFLHHGDGTSGYATAFTDRVSEALDGASSWRAAFRRARAAAKYAKGHDDAPPTSRTAVWIWSSPPWSFPDSPTRRSIPS